MYKGNSENPLLLKQNMILRMMNTPCAAHNIGQYTADETGYEQMHNHKCFEGDGEGGKKFRNVRGSSG